MNRPNGNYFIGTCKHYLLRPRINLLFTAVLIGALTVTLSHTSAATQIRVQQDILQINAKDSSIGEILNELSAKFKLTYRLPPGIGRNLTGFYSGTLYQALARILDGNDYVVEVSDGGIKVVVFRASVAIIASPVRQTIAATDNVIAPTAPLKQTNVSGPPSFSPPPPLSTYLSANEPVTTGQGPNSP